MALVAEVIKKLAVFGTHCAFYQNSTIASNNNQHDDEL